MSDYQQYTKEKATTRMYEPHLKKKKVDHERENAVLRHKVHDLEQQVKLVTEARQQDAFKLHRNDFDEPLSASGLIAATSSRKSVRHGYTSSVIPWKLTRTGCVKAGIPNGSRVMIKVISWENLVTFPSKASSSSAAQTARKTFDHIFRFVHEMMMISVMQGCNVNSVNDHVVRVISLMTDPLPAIVMEDWGESLHDFKTRLYESGKDISFGDAVDIVIDTTIGLQQMARMGVHQWDLNAGNVLVKRLTSNGRIVAKLCDFGFCRRTEERDSLTSLSLVGHMTQKTENMPHIHATVMSMDDDMDMISVRAMGYLMGFIASPLGTHHTSYTSRRPSHWDTSQASQFVGNMKACINGDMTSLNALRRRMLEYI